MIARIETVRLAVGAGLVLLLLAGSARPQDDTDKVVAGKRASEWLTLLSTAKKVNSAALIALKLAGPQTQGLRRSGHGPPH